MHDRTFSGLMLIGTFAALSPRSFSSWPAFVLKMPQLVLQQHRRLSGYAVPAVHWMQPFRECLSDHTHSP